MLCLKRILPKITMCNVYIKKKGKITSHKSDGSFKAITEMDTIVSGVKRCGMVRTRIRGSYVTQTRAYSRNVNGKG